MSDQDQDNEPQAAAPAEEKPPWLLAPVPPEWQEEDEDPLVKRLRDAHPGAIQSARSFAGDLTLVVERDAIAVVAHALKNDHGYGYIVDVAGADYPDRDERFEVVYHLYNHSQENRLRLNV